MANNASKTINKISDNHLNHGKGNLNIQHDKFGDHVKKGKFFSSLRKDTHHDDIVSSLQKHAKDTKWTKK